MTALGCVEGEGAKQVAVMWGSDDLIVVAGHSPHKETVLMLGVDDPEFFDCRFQR